MRRTIMISALIAGLAVHSAGQAVAKDESSPDWPCVQRKVADLSVNQVWDGPAIDGLPSWHDDESVSKLVPVLAARRIPLQEAEQKVKKFAEAIPADQRDGKLALLFAGLFQTISAERKTIVGGIEKFNRRQRELSANLEEKGSKLAELETKAASDESLAKELAEAQDRYEWDTRIFKERNDNIPLACEIPVIIDERLFGLAKAIRAEMKG